MDTCACIELRLFRGSREYVVAVEETVRKLGLAEARRYSAAYDNSSGREILQRSAWLTLPLTSLKNCLQGAPITGGVHKSSHLVQERQVLEDEVAHKRAPRGADNERIGNSGYRGLQSTRQPVSPPWMLNSKLTTRGKGRGCHFF